MHDERDPPIVGAILVYILAMLAFWPWPVRAHSVYDAACCSGRDCAPAPPGEVKVTPQGYLLRSTGTMIGYGDKRIKPTPPEDTLQRFHVCRRGGLPDGEVICIYAPQGGA